VSEREDKAGIRKSGGTPSPAPAPTEPEPPAASPPAGTFGGLRAFPSNPFQTTELPPPKSPIAELAGGALAGAAFGGFLAGAGGAVFGVPLGILDGYLVSRIADRAGKLTARAVLINFVRVPFMTLALLLFPFTFAYGLAHEEYEER
jgi:hypothetical protein